MNLAVLIAVALAALNTGIAIGYRITRHEQENA